MPQQNANQSWLSVAADGVMEERDKWKARARAAETRLAALEAALPALVEQACEAQRVNCADALPSSPKDFVGIGIRVESAPLPPPLPRPGGSGGEVVGGVGKEGAK